MKIVGNVEKRSDEELKKKEVQENNKSDDRVEANGNLDVRKKYKLTGPVLSQGEIDNIVDKYRKK